MRYLCGYLLRKFLMSAIVLACANTVTAQQVSSLIPGNYTADQLFRHVSTAAGYNFAINAQFDRKRNINLPVSLSTVGEILDLALADSGYKYEIQGRYVMVKSDPDHKMPDDTGKIDPWGPKICYFVIDNTILMRDFKTNGPALDGLDALLRDPAVYPNIDSIIVTAAASPIASQQYNARLAIARAEALAVYVRWQHPQVDRECIRNYPMGIDWEGFWALIENTPGVPSRDKIMSLKGLNESVTLEMLRRVGGPETYRYLLGNIYPKLQYAAIRVVLKDGRSIPAEGSPLRQMVVPREISYDTVYVERVIRDTIRLVERVTVPVEQKPEPEPEPAPKGKPFYIALKNNLLLDAALLPNLAVEIPFGRDYGWSAELEGHWSWWNSEEASWWYHRVQMAGVEVRKWFGNRTGNPMNGFYAGVYGYGGTYDVRLFTKSKPELGQLSDMSWSVGFSVGYAMPVARRLNMEFGLGVGYFTGEYKKYYRCECEDLFPLVSTHKRKWLGPTKAKVSLVWQIGSGVNRNYKKSR